jgi:hypothetical protein
LARKNRQHKAAWKAEQRNIARASFPLSDDQLAVLFHTVESGLQEAGCDHSLRITRRWLDGTTHDPDRVIAWLQANGGFCDCEVVANARDHWQQSKV